MSQFVPLRDLLAGHCSLDQDNFPVSDLVESIAKSCDLKVINEWIAQVAGSDPSLTGPVKTLCSPLETIIE